MRTWPAGLNRWEAGGQKRHLCPIANLHETDRRRLQGSRIFLYKSRMTKRKNPLRERFFESIDDAAQLLRLFDFLPNTYLYVKDSESRFVAMNDAQMRIIGIKNPRAYLGKTDMDFHSVHWARLYQEEDRRVMNSGREIPEQIWLVTAEDGKLGTFCSSKIPVRGLGGNIIGIAGVMYRIDQPKPSSKQDDPVAVATEIMTRNFSSSLEIREIADEVGLSTSQLNRRFRDTFQMPPSEYLQRVRIHEASRLLADTDLAIGEVALETGFYDQAHLTRTFRRWMRITPRDFRKLSSVD